MSRPTPLEPVPERPSRALWWRWGLPLGFFVVVAAGVMLLHRDPLAGSPDATSITSAGFVADDAREAVPGSESVLLPHVWSEDPTDARRGRYTLRFDREAVPTDGAGLYVAAVNSRARVFLNGQSIGSGDDLAGLASSFWLVPLYRSIPAALLVPGANRLDIEVLVDDPGSGFLGPVHLGAETALRPAFEWRRFTQVTSIQIGVIAMVSLGFFLAGLSVLRRRDTAYLWFAVVVWIFAFGFWNLLAIESRIPKPPYRWVGAVTMAWLVAAITVFANRLLGERDVRVESLIGGGALVGSVYFAATLGTPAFGAAIPVWGVLVFGAGLYPAWRVARRHASAPSLETAVMVAAGILILAAGLHDIGLVNGALPIGHPFAIQYAAWASVALLSFMFVKRFVDALDTSEALTAELSERVREKAEELEAGHARLRVLERERAVATERQRILGEIHDGLGSQLVSALALVRGGEGDADETAEAIQSALDDMRLMIDSLDDVEGDLDLLLGSLRQRLGRRLERGGLTLHWEITDTPQPAGFGPESGLQVLRIAQESITNVIKHARASRVWVSTSVEGAGAERVVVLAIEDDGCGFDPAGPRAGRGLRHVRARAERIGARLEVASSGEGTRVRLAMPAPEQEGA